MDIIPQSCLREWPEFPVATLEGEDIQDALYGKSVCEVSFDEHSGEPNNVVPFRRNNRKILVSVLHSVSGNCQIFRTLLFDPESKLTKTDVLETLSGC